MSSARLGALLVSLWTAQAVAQDAALAVTWNGACPSQLELTRALEAAGLTVLADADLRVTVSTEGEALRVELAHKERRLSRTLARAGACDAQAAALAAVIERFARPLLAAEPAEASEPAAGAAPARTHRTPTRRSPKRAEREAPTAEAEGQGAGADPLPERGHGLEEPVVEEEPAVVVRSEPWKGLLGASAGVALALEAVRPGAEVSGLLQATRRFEVLFSLGWVGARTQPVGEGTLRLDELRLAAMAQLRLWEGGPLFVALGGGAQGLWARTTNLVQNGDAVRVNPLVKGAVTLRLDFTRVSWSLSVAPTWFVRTQRFRVEGVEQLVTSWGELNVSTAVWLAL